MIALSNALQYAEIIKFKEMLADDNRYLHAEISRLTGDSIIDLRPEGIEFIRMKIIVAIPIPERLVINPRRPSSSSM